MKRYMSSSLLCAALAVAVLLAVVTSLWADAESYIARFRDYTLGGAVLDFWIPTRDTSGNEVVYPVNSKWQQPRDQGTSPHQGTDLATPMNIPVYAPYWGWIVGQDGKNTSGVCCIRESTNSFEVVLRLDLNDNGVQDDQVYFKFDHVERVGYRSTGSPVTPSDQVATSGDENRTYLNAAHLHFGPLNPKEATTSNGRWTGLERHYTWVPEWRYGDDLDFISYVVKDTFNNVRATSYVMSDRVRQSLPAGNVVLFHRRSTGGTWSVRTMTAVAGEADRWEADLDTLGYGPGVSIHWMIRATRPGLVEPHNAAFFPPEFAHPNNNPNAVAAAYPFYTAVTQ
jgi:murein DD-endopeptidase MepM/ murein hydrolase activator NlpD